MILNRELDNSIEGNYLFVEKLIDSNTVYIPNLKGIKIQADFMESSWMLGWGNHKKYFDASNENLRMVQFIDVEKGLIAFGKLLRGRGTPQEGDKIVLWNKHPSGFKKMNLTPIIDANSGWKNFKGNSIMFGKIIHDSLQKRWIMYINEVDTPDVSIYAAVSTDLLNWKPEMNGMPVLKRSDFKDIKWALQQYKGRPLSIPVIKDAIYKSPYWYFFMQGYDKDKKYVIGLLKSKDPVNGPFEMLPSPLLEAGKRGTWDEGGCFYPKVCTYKGKYMLFYDGYDKDGTEQLGMAESDDLIHWKKSGNKSVLNGHTGWRSYLKSSEPAKVECRNDSIFLYLIGAKKFKNDFYSRITRKRFMDKPGNVNDNQMGCYLSVDGGKNFISHQNNPVFINDYSDPNENDHLGASIEWFQKNDSLYLFYLAKTDFPINAYHPFLRVKKINRHQNQ